MAVSTNSLGVFAATTGQEHLPIATDVVANPGKCVQSACREFEFGIVDHDCCGIPCMATCAPGYHYGTGRVGCGHGYANGVVSTCCMSEAWFTANKPAGTPFTEGNPRFDNGNEHCHEQEMEREQAPGADEWNENGEYAGQGFNPPDDVKWNAECVHSACEEYERGRIDTDCCSIPEMAFCKPGTEYRQGAVGCGWGLVQGQRSTCCVKSGGSSGTTVVNNYNTDVHVHVHGSGGETGNAGDSTTTVNVNVNINPGHATDDHFQRNWNDNGPYGAQGYDPPYDVEIDDSCDATACEEYEVGRLDTDCCALPEHASCAAGTTYRKGAEGCGWGLTFGQHSTCCVREDAGAGGAAPASGGGTSTASSSSPSNADLIASYNGDRAVPAATPAPAPRGPEDDFYKRLAVDVATNTVQWEVKQDRESVAGGTVLTCQMSACEEFAADQADPDCCSIPQFASCRSGHQYVPLMRHCAGRNDMGSRVTCCVAAEPGAALGDAGSGTTPDTGAKWFDRVFGAGDIEPDFCIPGFPRPANPYTCGGLASSGGGGTSTTSISASSASSSTSVTASGSSSSSQQASFGLTGSGSSFFDAEIIVGNYTSSEALGATVTDADLMLDDAYRNAKETGLRNAIALAADLPTGLIAVKADGFHVERMPSASSAPTENRNLQSGTSDSASTSVVTTAPPRTVRTAFTVKNMDTTNARVAASLRDRAATARIAALTRDAMRQSQSGRGGAATAGAGAASSWTMFSLVGPVAVKGSCVTSADRDFCERYSTTAFSDERHHGSGSGEDDSGLDTIAVVVLAFVGGIIAVVCAGGFYVAWKKNGGAANTHVPSSAKKVVHGNAETTSSVNAYQYHVKMAPSGGDNYEDDYKSKELTNAKKNHAGAPPAEAGGTHYVKGAAPSSGPQTRDRNEFYVAEVAHGRPLVMNPVAQEDDVSRKKEAKKLSAIQEGRSSRSSSAGAKVIGRGDHTLTNANVQALDLHARRGGGGRLSHSGGRARGVQDDNMSVSTAMTAQTATTRASTSTGTTASMASRTGRNVNRAGPR
eukprot:g13996.t1